MLKSQQNLEDVFNVDRVNIEMRKGDVFDVILKSNSYCRIELELIFF